jgi:hypothetical protein
MDDNKKYLYGAAIQGIQGYIFKTNKLKEIIGGSEMVECICTELFYNTAGISMPADDDNIILSAAGNIKYIFEDEQKCKDFVRIFPKVVMDYAPGITISQAVVSFIGDDFSKEIQLLENKLKSKRNRVPLTTEIGFMALERARRTGGVGTDYIDNEVVDSSIQKKVEASDNLTLFQKMTGFKPKVTEIAFDIEDISKLGNNSWIAVIHADGNGLGHILQSHGQFLVKNKKFAQFSKAIDDATKIAVKKAFEDIVRVDCEKKCLAYEQKHQKKLNYSYPIRPIVIGGDDLTVIIRADLAFEFTKVFLKCFEDESASLFKFIGLKEFEEGLTACAGIAFIKESYPLHYGLHLAEQLCDDAKKKVKKQNDDGLIMNPKYGQMPKSALAFFKVQDSFVEDLKELKERTLQTKYGLSYYYGPYLLEDADLLSTKLNVLKKEADKNDKSKAVGKLRQIVSETYKDKSTAVFMMQRMSEVNKEFYLDLKLESEMQIIQESANSPKKNTQSILLDLITLHSLNYGNREN